MQPQTLTIRLGQHTYQIPYLDRGCGFPVVFLHGLTASKENWLPLMSALAPHYRCISLDLFCLQRHRQLPQRYGIATEVACLHQAIAALGLDGFYLVGHSFGGWVATAYTLEHPRRVRACVLAAPAGIRDDRFCRRYQRFRLLLWDTPLVDLTLAALKGVARLRAKATPLERIREIRHQLRTYPLIRQFVRDRLHPENAIDTVEERLHTLALPVLIIAAERDDVIPHWHCQTYAERVPNARFALVTGAKHTLPRDRAPELSELILPFLQEVSQTPSPDIRVSAL